MTLYSKKPIWTNVKDWHSLTEIPEPDRELSAQTKSVVNVGDNNKFNNQPTIHPFLVDVSPVLRKLLWDTQVYPYSSLSVRVKRLGSARAIEKAKREGYEKGLLIETMNGQTTYLLLTEKGFEALNTPYPYRKRDVSLQHSWRVELLHHLLSHDPSYTKVFIEYPIDQKGSTADVATLRQDSGKEGWEVTISTTNAITNLLKYEQTNFVKVVFVAPDYRLKEAIKSTISGANLNSDLLARVEFRHFSQLLRRQRKLYRY